MLGAEILRIDTYQRNQTFLCGLITPFPLKLVLIMNIGYSEYRIFIIRTSLLEIYPKVGYWVCAYLRKHQLFPWRNCAVRSNNMIMGNMSDVALPHCLSSMSGEEKSLAIRPITSQCWRLDTAQRPVRAVRAFSTIVFMFGETPDSIRWVRA